MTRQPPGPQSLVRFVSTEKYEDAKKCLIESDNLVQFVDFARNKMDPESGVETYVFRLNKQEIQQFFCMVRVWTVKPTVERDLLPPSVLEEGEPHLYHYCWKDDDEGSRLYFCLDIMKNPE